MKVELEIMIERPVDVVLDYITDISKFTQWAENAVEAVQTSDGPVGVGTTCRIVNKTMGKTLEYEFEVTEFDPGNRYTASSTSGPFPMSMTYVVEQVGDKTKLHSLTEAEPGGIMALAGPLMNRKIKKQFESAHKNLKKLLESG
ncbi:MAG: SRPBCC family protein [SAR202 cluster bacterium]|nr:SRPBCC family protein [SAR202 cluster bacterium]MDP7103270.1 SRPBCC family protein [SAR202 cluster bacterium]MDP7224815.1 SRPBCC family protein [SAR202 cluster bacterium]MDP7412714.1 SRPBCC family protein [SAR202 cluster bacterium]MDP7533134.1 SRPBCC family protein [SAR202 cluster bacterium]